MAAFDRRSGVFCHPTALPGPHGIGSIGAPARSFVETIAAAGQSLWQLCPLGPTVGIHGDSPYQSSSSFALSPLLIDLEALNERGLLTDDALEPDPELDHELTDDRVAYDAVRSFKTSRLRVAFETFEREQPPDLVDGLEQFRAESTWLEEYAHFAALKADFDRQAWLDWPEPIRLRDPDALERSCEQRASDIRYHAFVQYLAAEQWTELRDHAAAHGVEIVGDLPIYVALDSADVWANPDIFELEDHGTPAVVSGVPPGGGGETDGQKWGNPVYDWDRLAETSYEWWVDRFERLFELVDIARLDHFLAFDRYWAIPADAPAHEGEWRDGPGRELFETVADGCDELPLIAEDLGHLTDGVERLRQSIGAPGMRVLQYADWCTEDHRYQPHVYPEDSVAYPATHDTNTVVGWYESVDGEQRDCLHYYLSTDGHEIHWEFLEAAWESDAVFAITPLPDLYGLDGEARFNTPGTADGNWDWRLSTDRLESFPTARLRELTARTDRLDETTSH
ncbi:4-alpha-glucanotransferase [Natronorubrum aibiense]|uniref:4-alpha-glucanotransferase n=1 Tax=Natronorubrum aibiense TaxID=348826 RepID=A0A5P9P0Y1_9EURY|nr:4-alpha-glucanotransferase [Natronorubrum aibiense]QFU81686.1 4-alpha-glucanotransferase [Natronorubrum aibiense]